MWLAVCIPCKLWMSLATSTHYLHTKPLVWMWLATPTPCQWGERDKFSPHHVSGVRLHLSPPTHPYQQCEGHSQPPLLQSVDIWVGTQNSEFLFVCCWQSLNMVSLSNQNLAYRCLYTNRIFILLHLQLRMQSQNIIISTWINYVFKGCLC